MHAIDNWDEGAAYNKVRHAANVGGCYSTGFICYAHEMFENQRLTDDLVKNRLAQGGFTAAELNPAPQGAKSVCRYVSVPVLNRLIEGMQGSFTPEGAYHFCDYHMGDADLKTLQLIAGKTSFTQEERSEFMEMERADFDISLEPSPTVPEEPRNAQAARPAKKTLRRFPVWTLVIVIPLCILVVMLLYLCFPNEFETFLKSAAKVVLFVVGLLVLIALASSWPGNGENASWNAGGGLAARTFRIGDHVKVMRTNDFGRKFLDDEGFVIDADPRHDRYVVELVRDYEDPEDTYWRIFSASDLRLF